MTATKTPFSPRPARTVERSGGIGKCRPGLRASGEAALRLADIATRVGVTQPAIYSFFEHREDLVIAAHRERFRRFTMEAFRGSDQSGLDRLTRAEYLAVARADMNQALTIAAWLRGQLFSRCLIEEDPDRYDGEEWNRLTVEAALQFLLLPADPAAS